MGETNSLQGNPCGEGRGWKTQNKLEIEFWKDRKWERKAN